MLMALNSTAQGSPLASLAPTNTPGATASNPIKAGGLPHLQWLVDTGERLKTADGKTIEVWEFQHAAAPDVLSAWARHFRNHYCSDSDIDFLKGKATRKEFLENLKFPSKTTSLGPSVRAGDFGEILVADYLQWILGFSVPRVRWNGKIVRDESSKGSDVIGFHFHDASGKSPKDRLAVFETKTRFSASGNANRLQDAISDSAKDHIRIDESLNYIKQRLFEKGEKAEASKIERFQNPVDIPYQEVFGAAAIYSQEHYDPAQVCLSDTKKISKPSKPTEFKPHPKRDALVLVVIKGTDMMNLVNELYRRAADEA
jgi:hypothetical protein